MGIKSKNPKSLSGKVIEKRLELITRPSFASTHYKIKSIPKGKVKKKIKTVGILTSGGDGPAENSAIQALVQRGIDDYGWRMLGIRDGFKGLLDPGERIREIQLDDVRGSPALKKAREVLYITEKFSGGNGLKGIEDLGGNLLRSSRANPVEYDAKGKPNIDKVKKAMGEYGIDALVVLGGNGTLRACNDLHKMGIPLVFIPQSIDADVPGSVTSIGHPSSVNRGASELAAFLNTAQSGGRWFLVEVMGQRYGMLTLGIALNAKGGHYFDYGKHQGMPIRVDTIFTELTRSMEEISLLMQRRKGFGQDHGLILISEGVHFDDASPPREINKYNRLLIEAGDITRWVRQRLLTRHDIRNTRSVSLGYSLRGAGPTTHDINLSHHFAKSALGLLAAGNFDRMVGIDFIGQTGSWSMQYPLISKAAPGKVLLNPEYFNFVRRNLEIS